MASLNKVLLMGNLTRNPEIRYTPSGSAVCEFGMAINRRFMQANGQEKDETCFVDIVVWGKQAESTSRFLQKGSSVFIEGRLVYDQWEEKETQKKRSRLRVNADRVQFLDRREDRGGEVPPDGGQPGGYSQYNNRGSQGSYGAAQGGYSNVPQGAYSNGASQYAGKQQQPSGRPQPQQQQQYRQQADDVPQMPIEEPPFETVEGVDDDIPF